MSKLSRKYHPQEKIKAQKICGTFRLIFFKIPLYLWLGLLFIVFCVTKCNIAAVLLLCAYPGAYIWLWLLIWHFITRKWEFFV